MISSSTDDDDHGGDGGAGDFQGSHVDIPDRASGIDFSQPQPATAGRQAYPGKGSGSKEPKIIRGCCKVM